MFRFDIAPEQKVNTLIPREVAEAVVDQPYKVPYTQVGAAMKQSGVSFTALPKKVALLAWEIDVKMEVPYTARPIKPKVWLLGKHVLKKGTAYKLA